MSDGETRKTQARLVYIAGILNANPQGIRALDLAQKCDVSPRSIYRDLKAIDQKMGIKMWQEKGQWGLLPGTFLPPISFTTPELMIIFIAARLLLSYINANNPNIVSTFNKLNCVVPSPLKEQIVKTMEWMQQQKTNKQFCFNLEVLSQAWVSRSKVKIRYRTLGEREAKERIVEPYFIQPAAIEHANYVIGYCHLAKEIRTFKIERIQNVTLLDEHYTVPEDFDANAYLGAAWGITVYGRIEKVRLKFDPELAPIAEETVWHPSQVTQMQLDGSAIVQLDLAITNQLESFILGWGGKVEVLEPAKLRIRIAKTANAISQVYHGT
jgi:predicted DNA-binding transcriptional regulator YafY